MDLKAVKIGIGAGLIASLCCVGPFIAMLLFITLGIGSISMAFTVASYKYHFLALSIIFITAAIYYHIKKKQGACNVKSIESNKYFIITSIIVMIIIYLLSLYILLPLAINLFR